MRTKLIATILCATTLLSAWGTALTSFVRGRYEFEVALHELSIIGPKELRGGLYRYLEYLGVAAKVECVIAPHLYRSIFPGLDITLPVGREAFEAKLCGVFPHESKGIHRFLDRVFGMGRDFARIVKERGVETACPCLSAFLISPLFADPLGPVAEQGRERPAGPCRCSPSTGGMWACLHPRYPFFSLR